MRTRLLAAAAAEFARSGYAGATLDGIAARAGVTKGGVYFHFAGKEELFFAVLDEWRERRRARLHLPPPAAGGAAAALRTLLAAWIAFHLRDADGARLLRVLRTELHGRFTARLREDDRQEQRWLRSAVRELLVLGARDGTLAADDPALAAFALSAAAFGVLEQWLTAPADVEDYCEEQQLAAFLVARHATGGSSRHSPDGGDGEFDFRARAPR